MSHYLCTTLFSLMNMAGKPCHGWGMWPIESIPPGSSARRQPPASWCVTAVSIFVASLYQWELNWETHPFLNENWIGKLYANHFETLLVNHAWISVTSAAVGTCVTADYDDDALINMPWKLWKVMPFSKVLCSANDLQLQEVWESIFTQAGY